MAYEFHYTPTGTGVISGKEVLEQTEDAINDLGNTAISGVQEALDKAEQALTNSENAVDDAQTALNTANNAEGVAIQAQNDVSNLSGTVTNIGNRVTTAEGNITNLQGRMTTAEGNITNIQGRMTTAETNIGNLQTAVSTAQATANSAQQTATTARQQSYVFRYSSTAITDNSTIAYSTLDNTDNIKADDKIIDVDGKLFKITAVDTTNQTVTVGSALIDLALDANVVHTSGDETIDGNKTFSKYITSDGSSTGDEYSNNARTNLWLMGNRDTEDVSGVLFDTFRQNTAQGTGLHILGFGIKENSVRYEGCRFSWLWDNNLSGYTFDFKPTTQGTNQAVKHNLGTSTDKWSEVHGVTYYYGSSDTEFSQKFVTTDTAQTISGDKTWTYQQIWNVNCQRRIISTFEKGETPPSNYSRNDYYTVKNGTTAYANALGVFGCSITTGNKVSTYFHALKNQAGVSTRTTFEVSYDTNTDQKEVSTNADFLPTSSGQGIGNSTKKWATINGLNPGSLGMPDLNNGVDISGYLSVGTSTNDSYTAPANGYIGVIYASSSSCGCYVYNYTDGVFMRSNSITDSTYTNVCGVFIPILKNQTMNIASRATESIVSAKFIPCQGNI